VAKAYLDQLERSRALPANEVASLRKAIRSAEKSHLKAKQLAKLGGMTSGLESSAAGTKTAADASRIQALEEILKHPVA
jgi:hypothetical protein